MSDKMDAEKLSQVFAPKAQALPAEIVINYRGFDVDLATTNLQTAMRYFAAKKADIPAHLPQVDVKALEELTALALAVKFVDMKAEQTVPSEQLVRSKQKEANTLRAILLPAAKALAASGLVPQNEVADIARGQGARDKAGDCVLLAELFRKHESKIAGKHAVEAAQVEQAAEVGSWLWSVLRKESAPSEKAMAVPPVVDLRNRLATMLVQRYDRLEVVAHYFEGSRYRDFVPPLMARVVKRSAAEPEAVLDEEEERAEA